MNDKNEHTFQNGDETDLEARVTAWVLGEASPFEAEQLERLAAEKPEIAVFKRRIQAVHGLMGEAARPAQESLRLSAERRAKVLAAIGTTPERAIAVAAAPAAESTSRPNAASASVFSQREPAREGRPNARWRKWMAPVAACVTLGFILGVVVVPNFTEKLAPRKAKRPSPADTLLGSSVSEQLEVAAPQARVGPRAGADDNMQLDAFVVGPLQTAPEKKKDSRTFQYVSPVQRPASAAPAIAGASPVAGLSFGTTLSAPLADNERSTATREGAAAGGRSRARDDLVVRVDETLRTEASAKEEAMSTFSLHVSDASFRLARSALARGEAPEGDRVRPEEFYNAFDYGDPAPLASEAVSCRVEQSAHPFLQQRNLLRVAVRAPAAGRSAGRPLRLTVMVDTSGSMEREDRAATVRRAFEALASLLGPQDVITVIGFARQPRLLAEGVRGDQAGSLAEIVARTPAEGGTNLEAALALAGEIAVRQRIEGAQNRIVLLTDGAANLGDADPARLAARIVALRQQGIAFDACGVGSDGVDDRVLEALTREGDGRYQVLRSPEEADSGFARKLAGAFRPAAENVKVQIRFNTARVSHYRLIGFEQHRLRAEDFRNDAVDAAELAAEEAGVALYQVETLPEGEGEIGEVFVRFRDAATGQMIERSWTVSYDSRAPAFGQASPAMKLAGVSAFLAEKLRGGDLASQIRFEDFTAALNDVRNHFSRDARVRELAEMFEQARRVLGE